MTITNEEFNNNKRYGDCKHEHTHVERVRGWQIYYPYVPCKIYCDNCGKEMKEQE